MNYCIGLVKSKRKLARLKADLHEARITQARVAAASGTSTQHVCNVLAGRVVSANVVNAAIRLLAEKAEHAVA